MIRLLKEWRQRRAEAKITIDDAQWRRVEQTLPFLGYLASADRMRLRQLARSFLARKEWSSAAELPLDGDLQLSISLQACLPILNLGLDWYDGWVGIVVYPGDFVIPRRLMDADGVMHEFDDEVMGEAWEGGPVLLSWTADQDTGRTGERINVVIHEFAHKLDMLHGDANGMPPLHENMSTQAWISTMQAAYDDFCDRVDGGEDTALDPYAAENPAEFFAVTSEAFFEAPMPLRRDYPAVYEQLKAFYRQDPALMDGGHPVR